MRALADLPQELEVLAVAVVVVARDLRGVGVGDPAGLLLELPPIAVAVAAFDLVCRARGSPQESLGEARVHDQAAAVAGFATAGGGMYPHVVGVSPSMSSRSMPALSTFLRYISRSLWARPSSRIQAAFSGSAWLTIAWVSPGRSRTMRRATASTRPPRRSTDSSPGTSPRLALCTNHRGRRSGICQ